MTQRIDWKKALLRAEELRSTGVSNAYELMTVLLEVFDDWHFLQQNGLSDEFQAGDFLNKYVRHLNMPFLQLRAVYKRFPDRKDWAAGDLYGLYRKVIDEREAERLAQPKVARRSVKVSDVEEAQRKAKHAEAVARKVETKAKTEVAEVKAKAAEAVKAAEVKVERVKTEVETLRERCGALERENAELRAENARLKEALAKARRKATKTASV